MQTEIPEGWSRASLLEVASIANGQVDPKTQPFQNWPLIAPNHIESGTGRLLEIETAAEQGAISGKYRVQPGEVVYGKIRPYLRKAWLADRKALCSADMYPMQAGPDLDPGFLLALLLGEGFSRFAEGVSARTGIPKINRDELATYRTALPPLPEQKKIAAVLASVDEAIRATEAVIEQTRRVKEGLLQDLLTRGIGHTRFKQTEIGEIPEAWEVREIATLGLVDSGKAKNKRQDDPLRPYLRVANVLDDEIDSSDILTMPFSDEEFERWRLERGDILLNEGQSLELVGRPAVYQGDPPNVAMQNALLRWRPDPSLVDPDFGYQVIRSLYLVGKFSQVATKTTSIAHLGLKRFAGISVPVPPMSEQKQIAGVLMTVDHQRRENEAAVRRFKDVKAGLLQDLLTGAVRVSP